MGKKMKKMSVFIFGVCIDTNVIYQSILEKKKKKTKKIKTDLHEFPPEVANPDKVSIKSLSEEN